MIKVTLVSNHGDGVPVTREVCEGTSLDSFLSVFWNGYQDVNVDDFDIRVRNSDGESNLVSDLDSHVLENGDRVSIAPRKIEGATL